MNIGVEISLYPLRSDFIPPIQGFIDRLNADGRFKVLTNDRAYLTPGPATVVALPADRLHLFGADGARFA